MSETLSEEHDSGISRERQGELLTRLMDTATKVKGAEGKHLAEVLGNEESRRLFLERLSNDEFFELINGINGIARGKNKEEWAMDGETVLLTGFAGEHFPPRQSDKPELLAEALNGAKAMSGQGRDIKDMAILLSTVINEAHPYKDANGRTSRFVYTVLTRGYNSESKKFLTEILGEEGRWAVDVTAEGLQSPIHAIMRKEQGYVDEDKNEFCPENVHQILNFGGETPTGQLQFAADVTPHQREDFIELLRRDRDDPTVTLALYQYANSRSDVEKFLREFPTHNQVNMDTFAPTLTAADIDQITNNYWRLKKEFVEKIIDCVVNPKKPEYQIKDGDHEESLLEHLKQRITDELT